MKEFSNLECAKVMAAWDLRHVLMCPNDLNLAHAIEHNPIGNHKNRREDIRNTNQKYGKCEVMMKEKVVK